MSRYGDAYRRSLDDSTRFWAEAAEGIAWSRPWDTILDDSNPPHYRWFRGATLNTCYNALDRHVESGRADLPALIYDSPVTGVQRTLTYRALRDETAVFAGALSDKGVSRSRSISSTECIHGSKPSRTILPGLAASHFAGGDSTRS